MLRQSLVVKQIWQGRIAQAATKVGDKAPMTVTCCNACRMRLTTNLAGVALAGVAADGTALVRYATRALRTP